MQTAGCILLFAGAGGVVHYHCVPCWPVNHEFSFAMMSKGISSGDSVDEVMLLLHNLVQVLVSGEKNALCRNFSFFSMAPSLLDGSRAGLAESNERVQRP